MPATPPPIPTLREAVEQFQRLVRLIRSYWVALLKGVFIGLVSGVIGMVTPYLTKLLIDEVYPAQDVVLMHVIVGGLLAVSLTSSFIGVVRGYYNLYVNTHLSNATQLFFFNHLQHLPQRFFEQHKVGEIMSRFKDVGSALGSVSQVLGTVFGQGFYLLLVPPFLFWLQWKLALVALISIPFTVLLTTLAGRLLRKYWKRTSEAYADLNALQVETLSQIRMLKTLALERHVYQRAQNQFDHAMRMQLKAGGLGQLLGLGNGLLYALNTAIFTWFGWTLILSGQMTLGSYIAFTAYIGYLYSPFRQLVNLFSSFQQSAVHLGRMFEYLDTEPEQDPALVYEAVLPVQHALQGQVTLRDITFGYQPEEPVLHGIDLQIEPGSVTALVGPSGSGKTSLLRLLVGMERPQRGQILFDGLDATQIALPDLRRQLAVVWQEFSLMEGTIWENLTPGLLHPTPHAVNEAMAICQLDGLIKSLPLGYETPVAEWGASLSGGQRQRLALARALLRNAPILLLDEVTSNVDVQTEEAILRDLFPALRGRTVIFVTHRVITAALADQICVLHQGYVEGRGTHQELLRTCALYRTMHGLAAQPHPTPVKKYGAL